MKLLPFLIANEDTGYFDVGDMHFSIQYSFWDATKTDSGWGLGLWCLSSLFLLEILIFTLETPSVTGGAKIGCG